LSADRPVKLAPSILSADFARLGDAVREATEAGADYIHVDVMDGQFVPRITIGAPVVAAIRSWTRLPLDVHLMIEDPGRQVEQYAKAGADIITVHVEADTHLHRTVHEIKRLGARAGVALNPATPLSAVEEILPSVDIVMLMTVNPGFGGQTFIEDVCDKIARARAELERRGLTAELEVDGGISTQNAASTVRAGATVLVAGSAVFDSGLPVKDAVARLLASLT
jgi:ribulose-phosphate 3-epimerase